MYDSQYPFGFSVSVINDKIFVNVRTISLYLSVYFLVCSRVYTVIDVILESEPHSSHPNRLIFLEVNPELR